MADVNYPFPDHDYPASDTATFTRQLAEALRGAMNGKINPAVTFTLNTTGITTTVQDPRIAATSRILLHPLNTHAAGDWASGTVLIAEAGVVPGQFTVQHTISTLARKFRASFLS